MRPIYALQRDTKIYDNTICARKTMKKPKVPSTEWQSKDTETKTRLEIDRAEGKVKRTRSCPNGLLTYVFRTSMGVKNGEHYRRRKREKHRLKHFNGRGVEELAGVEYKHALSIIQRVGIRKLAALVDKKVSVRRASERHHVENTVFCKVLSAGENIRDAMMSFV